MLACCSTCHTVIGKKIVTMTVHLKVTFELSTCCLLNWCFWISIVKILFYEMKFQCWWDEEWNDEVKLQCWIWFVTKCITSTYNQFYVYLPIQCYESCYEMKFQCWIWIVTMCITSTYNEFYVYIYKYNAMNFESQQIICQNEVCNTPNLCTFKWMYPIS